MKKWIVIIAFFTFGVSSCWWIFPPRCNEKLFRIDHIFVTVYDSVADEGRANLDANIPDTVSGNFMLILHPSATYWQPDQAFNWSGFNMLYATSPCMESLPADGEEIAGNGTSLILSEAIFFEGDSIPAGMNLLENEKFSFAYQWQFLPGWDFYSPPPIPDSEIVFDRNQTIFPTGNVRFNFEWQTTGGRVIADSIYLHILP